MIGIDLILRYFDFVLIKDLISQNTPLKHVEKNPVIDCGAINAALCIITT